MDFKQIALNDDFRIFAAIEAIKILATDSGIPPEELIKQFKDNEELQNACAKIIVESAKILAD